MKFLNLVYIVISLFISVVNLTAQNPSPASQRIGLCLSGGGALGYAHIGALQALEEAGIRPTHISANSMGSIVGVLYAAGISPADMLRMIEQEKGYRIHSLFDVNLGKNFGFMKHDKLRKVLDKYIPYNNFDSLQTKFYVCCVDIRRGKVKIVSQGNKLKDYVIASSSIPLLYEYCVIEGVEYVDGGIKNNFPLEPLLEEKCDKIIGINVINFTPSDTTIKAEDLLSNLYAIIDESINEHKYKQCDFYVPIKGLNSYKYSTVSYKRYKEIYQIGYENMKAYIEQHPEILE
jgi:NTE family protein